jgi:propionyl-CoA synthetase
MNPPAFDRYRRVHGRSLADPQAFWLEAAAGIDWIEHPTQALHEHEDGSWTWFPGGLLNTSANALDRHVDAGRGERAALIYDSAMTGERRVFSYRELLDEVARFAGALRHLGVDRGDRVVIYLPMTPEAVITMLACARIGAIHSVVFGGFAANELAARVSDARPKVIVTSSGGLEPGKVVEYLPLAARALELADAGVETVIVAHRPEVPGSAEAYDGRGAARWISWDAAVAGATPAGPVALRSDDPLYILYTSGTTGVPKGIVRDNGGHAVALSWSMQNVYGLARDEVFWAASDIGWAVGHSYTVYAPLIAGATSVLYEGKPVGTPDAGAFWRVVQDNRVSVLFTAPTAIRAIRRVDPELSLLAGYDTGSLGALFLAGERLDPETYHWIHDGLGLPVIDHWWQTETGWPIAAIPRGVADLPGKAGSANLPMPGYAVDILDGRGTPIPSAGTEGNIGIRLPLAPGNLLGIWGAPERFREAYLSTFPGYYATGDSGYVDDEGYLFVMGRTDDVINVAGHRLSTGAVEEVLAKHDAVAECAVIGVRDELKGQRAAGFVTLKAGHAIEAVQLTRELVELVREHIGPVAAFRDVVVVERLPKTRSGKVLRKTIRQMVDGDPVTVPATIEDPSVLDALREALDARPIAVE